MRHFFLFVAAFFTFLSGVQAASMPKSATATPIEIAGKTGGVFGNRQGIMPSGTDEQLDYLSDKMIANAKASLGLFIAQLVLNVFATLLLLGATTTAGAGAFLLLAGLGFLCGLASLIFLIIGFTNKKDLDNGLMARDNLDATQKYRAKTSSARVMLNITAVLTGLYIFINLIALVSG